MVGLHQDGADQNIHQSRIDLSFTALDRKEFYFFASSVTWSINQSFDAAFGSVVGLTEPGVVNVLFIHLLILAMRCSL